MNRKGDDSDVTWEGTVPFCCRGSFLEPGSDPRPPIAAPAVGSLSAPPLLAPKLPVSLCFVPLYLVPSIRAILPGGGSPWLLLLLLLPPLGRLVELGTSPPLPSLTRSAPTRLSPARQRVSPGPGLGQWRATRTQQGCKGGVLSMLAKSPPHAHVFHPLMLPAPLPPCRAPQSQRCGLTGEGLALPGDEGAPALPHSLNSAAWVLEEEDLSRWGGIRVE